MATPITTPAQVKAIVERFIADEQARFDAFWEECELPRYKGEEFADVRVIEKDNHVLVTYDGAGYDQLSIESYVEVPMPDGSWEGRSGSEKTRARLAEALPGCLIEDCNSWSLSIWIN
jgi:hypothetical protein